MKYRVRVKQTTTYEVEVEAPDMETAESLCWDLMHDDDVSSELDGDAVVEYIIDEQGEEWSPRYRGGYERIGGGRE